jgi:hypothetical protein
MYLIILVQNGSNEYLPNINEYYMLSIEYWFLKTSIYTKVTKNIFQYQFYLIAQFIISATTNLKPLNRSTVILYQFTC